MRRLALQDPLGHLVPMDRQAPTECQTHKVLPKVAPATATFLHMSAAGVALVLLVPMHLLVCQDSTLLRRTSLRVRNSHPWDQAPGETIRTRPALAVTPACPLALARLVASPLTTLLTTNPRLKV